MTLATSLSIGTSGIGRTPLESGATMAIPPSPAAQLRLEHGRPAGVDGVAERGRQHPLSLRFVAAELEHLYQRHAGAESLAGLRIITGAAAVIWLAAAFLIPLGTDLSHDLAMPASLVMSAIGATAFLAASGAHTLDRQHAIASLLTAANGLVILWLASVGGALPGYGVSALLLLFAYGFVSRTRFVYAAFRSVVIGGGFIVAVISHRGPESLLIDAFIFVTAVFGTLLALRLLERARRRVFIQDLVIAEQSQALEREKEASDRLLLNILPARISARLRAGELTIADEYPSASVLFADIIGFTPLAARLNPVDVIELLNGLFASFDELVAERGLEKIKTMGDSYMVAGGVPEPLEDHARRTVDLGLAMIEVAAREGAARAEGACALRVGVHSGPVLAGVIGRRKFAFDVWGDTVNVASRLESQGLPNRVHVSEATWLLVKDEFGAERRGSIDLRGHGAMQTYAIASRPGSRAHARGGAWWSAPAAPVVPIDGTAF
jgi:class 3 adenylate cyclase